MNKLESKSIINSKTFWLNAVTGLIAMLAVVDPSLVAVVIPDPEIAAQVTKIVFALVALANIYLRTQTKTKVVLKK